MRPVNSEDSDHLLMQGQSDFAICGDKRRDYKSFVNYITVSVKVLICSVTSDLGLHLRPVCPNKMSKYRNSIKSNPFRNHPGFAPDLYKNAVL